MDPFLQKLAEQGLLGLLFALLVFVWWKDKDTLRACLDNRFLDWKSIAEVLEKNSVALSDFTTASEARTRAGEALARVQELAAAAAQANSVEMARLRQSNEELRAEVQRLREELLRRPPGTLP